MDDLERKLRAAFSEVPTVANRTDGRRVAARAEELARRRQRARQRAAAVAVGAVLVAGVAGLAVQNDGGARVTVAGDPAVEAATAQPATTTTGAPPSATSTATPSVSAPPVTVPPPTLPMTPTTAAPATTTSTTDPAADADAPPRAEVRGRSGTVEASIGTTCWTPRTSGRAGYCADASAEWGHDAPVLAVDQGETLAVVFAIDEQPKSVTATFRPRGLQERRPMKIEGGNPARLLVALPPGEWTIELSTYCAPGDVHYAFNLAVRA